MTSSRSLDRSQGRCLEREREDLECLFGGVLLEVFGEEPEAVSTGSEPDAALAGGASALLAIHDERDDTYLGVHLRLSGELAGRLAGQEAASPETARENLLAAVGTLGTLAGDRLMTLLFAAARLSLPSATLDEVGLPPTREDAATPTVLRAVLAGQVAELALVPHVEAEGLAWPPLESDVLEAQA